MQSDAPKQTTSIASTVDTATSVTEKKSCLKKRGEAVEKN